MARYRPTDKEAQATGGIYMEVTGETGTADQYYGKEGPEFQGRLKALFQ
ncbi:hypothetical protein N9W62_06065 [Akkermansiaceae bacterium]|nr:hypothetical protein [Akkermansiaceae bacterium]